jgi:hypothetical protein
MQVKERRKEKGGRKEVREGKKVREIYLCLDSDR